MKAFVIIVLAFTAISSASDLMDKNNDYKLVDLASLILKIIAIVCVTHLNP